MGEHLAACFLGSHFQKFLRYGDLIDFLGQHFPKGIDISGFRSFLGRELHPVLELLLEKMGES